MIFQRFWGLQNLLNSNGQLKSFRGQTRSFGDRVTLNAYSSLQYLRWEFFNFFFRLAAVKEKEAFISKFVSLKRESVTFFLFLYRYNSLFNQTKEKNYKRTLSLQFSTKSVLYEVIRFEKKICICIYIYIFILPVISSKWAIAGANLRS